MIYEERFQRKILLFYYLAISQFTLLTLSRLSKFQKFKDDGDMKKGIAFPTCLSVNNCICHFSPSKNDPDLVLKEDDLVKIDLGAHIDGFIAVAAHTMVVGAKPDNKVKGRKADVILAAYHSSQAALRLLKNDKGNYEITEAIQKIAEAYKCKPIEGMLSHQLKQFKIDGEKTIIQNPTAAQKKEHEKCTFENYEVYAMDVLISTGEGAVSNCNSNKITKILKHFFHYFAGQGIRYKSFNLQKN